MQKDNYKNPRDTFFKEVENLNIRMKPLLKHIAATVVCNAG